MTGRYPQHTGVYWFSGADYALNETFQILPQMLSKAGYTSHAVGKVGRNFLLYLLHSLLSTNVVVCPHTMPTCIFMYLSSSSRCK